MRHSRILYAHAKTRNCSGNRYERDEISFGRELAATNAKSRAKSSYGAPWRVWCANSTRKETSAWEQLRISCCPRDESETDRGAKMTGRDSFVPYQWLRIGRGANQCRWTVPD
ncbi:hypothetical protein EUGRSUZ_B03493 [Eucalyptus grandis]|uniref:Uncharacterized protein n=2 Tax=Eucalyptus grandis TaxID=71139 RepID=A0ACC3LWN6_EUCGR|nr:hypothetical protein EUGRSUZ_B03493 [Eucalyptus grandis]